MKKLIIIALTTLSAIHAAAWDTLEVEITHPDNEVKNYSFLPSEADPNFKLKITGKTECYAGAIFLDRDDKKKSFDGLKIECYVTPKSKTETIVNSSSPCGSFSFLKIQEPKEKKHTTIRISCK